MYENINTDRVDNVYTPEKLKTFMEKFFPDLDKIKAKDVWNEYSHYFRSERLEPCRDVLYYVMERDGWSRRRFNNAYYFLRPGYIVKRGRPEDSKTIKQLKARIAALEAENKELKNRIYG